MRWWNSFKDLALDELFVLVTLTVLLSTFFVSAVCAISNDSLRDNGCYIEGHSFEGKTWFIVNENIDWRADRSVGKFYSAEEALAFMKEYCGDK